jgi:hypothetical protein
MDGDGEEEKVMRKKRADNEKGNSWNEEKESQEGKEAAGNTNGSLRWAECESPVSEKKSAGKKMSAGRRAFES